jgi:CBS-domain-containing membrane protein
MPAFHKDVGIFSMLRVCWYFGFPDAPFSQPRNVIVGHVMCSFVGLSSVALFGQHWWHWRLRLLS